MHDIIFGHNMRNGSMFGKLKQLVQSDASEHGLNPYIYVYTPDKVHKYKIIGYYITTVGSPSYDVVTTDEQYDEYGEYYIEYYSPFASFLFWKKFP